MEYEVSRSVTSKKQFAATESHSQKTSGASFLDLLFFKSEKDGQNQEGERDQMIEPETLRAEHQ